jgi:DNA-binding transcriptional ArsR family regulator
MQPQRDIAVLSQPHDAATAIEPTRRRILELLREPDSSTGVAKQLGLPRQRVNYHVRELEKAGLVEEVGRRQKRGLAERLLRATASHYLISPDAMPGMGADPEQIRDRFSASYQVAVAARTIHEVGRLMELAREAGKPLPTLTLDTEIRFATPADRDAFADELIVAVAALAAKYQATDEQGGRSYRVTVGAHPVYRTDADPGPTSTNP